MGFLFLLFLAGASVILTAAATFIVVLGSLLIDIINAPTTPASPIVVTVVEIEEVDLVVIHDVTVAIVDASPTEAFFVTPSLRLRLIPCRPIPAPRNVLTDASPLVVAGAELKNRISGLECIQKALLDSVISLAPRLAIA